MSVRCNDRHGAAGRQKSLRGPRGTNRDEVVSCRPTPQRVERARAARQWLLTARCERGRGRRGSGRRSLGPFLSLGVPPLVPSVDDDVARLHVLEEASDGLIDRSASLHENDHSPARRSQTEVFDAVSSLSCGRRLRAYLGFWMEWTKDFISWYPVRFLSSPACRKGRPFSAHHAVCLPATFGRQMMRAFLRRPLHGLVRLARGAVVHGDREALLRNVEGEILHATASRQGLWPSSESWGAFFPHLAHHGEAAESNLGQLRPAQARGGHNEAQCKLEAPLRLDVSPTAEAHPEAETSAAILRDALHATVRCEAPAGWLEGERWDRRGRRPRAQRAALRPSSHPG